jgi:hypothetical protein
MDSDHDSSVATLAPARGAAATNGATPGATLPIDVPARLVQALCEVAAQTPQGRALLDGFLLGRGIETVARCQLVCGPATLVPTQEAPR